MKTNPIHAKDRKRMLKLANTILARADQRGVNKLLFTLAAKQLAHLVFFTVKP